MSNHTPGPWIIGTDPRYPSEPCIDAVVDGVVWHIALCHMGLGPDDTSADANARLIACAPELYAALKEALPVLRGEVEQLAAAQAQAGASAEKVSTFSKARARYAEALAVIEKAEGVRPLTRRTGGVQNHGRNHS
jgi:hypothetical protein